MTERRELSLFLGRRIASAARPVGPALIGGKRSTGILKGQHDRPVRTAFLWARARRRHSGNWGVPELRTVVAVNGSRGECVVGSCIK
jgi:hypothetical protein